MKYTLPSRISLRARALNFVLRASLKPVLFFSKTSPITMRVFNVFYANACRQLRISKIPNHVRTQSLRLNGFDAEWLATEGTRFDSEKVFYYLHGGGYFFSSAQLHRSVTWRLAHYTKRPVFAINYRDAPDYNIEHCLDDALAGYDYLLNQGYAPENIVIGGDSAGGHLTLITLQHLKQSGRPMPSAALLISPLTDISCESASLQHNNLSDPFFWGHAIRSLANYLRRDVDPKHPVMSPVHGDFNGLPPLMFIVSAAEVLRDDARRAARNASEAGVTICYEEWHSMPHVFPFFANWLPEGKWAFKHIAAFIEAVENGTVKSYVLTHSADIFLNDAAKLQLLTV